MGLRASTLGFARLMVAVAVGVYAAIATVPVSAQPTWPSAAASAPEPTTLYQQMFNDGPEVSQPVPVAEGPGGPVDAAYLSSSGDCWTWQSFPNRLLYPSYLAGNKEPRIGTQIVHLPNHGWFWDSTLGGRAGLLRYGNTNAIYPEGWQLDGEGAAFPRLDPETNRQLRSVDFRVGTVMTYRRGIWESKFGYYHLCSHLGDGFLEQEPTYPRIGLVYVRDSLIWGVAARPWHDVRLYAEIGYAFHAGDGAQPWELQFGAEYSSVEPSGTAGSPFVAVNGHLREENDFGGNVTFQAGWQWRGLNGRLLRCGFQYFDGMSEQYPFFDKYEQQVGLGAWFDF